MRKKAMSAVTMVLNRCSVDDASCGVGVVPLYTNWSAVSPKKCMHTMEPPMMNAP